MNEMVEQYDDELSDQITKEVQQANLAENALLGLIFRDDTIYASAGVSEDWFQTPTLRTIYKAMGEILGDSKPVDVITVSDHLGRSNPRINWLEVCVDITRNGGGVAENLEHYVDIIRDSFTKRRAREIADRMLMTVHNGIGAVDEAIRDLMLLGDTQKKHEYDAPSILRAAIEYTEMAFEKNQSGETVGLPTGLRDLDEATGGLHDTDLVVILARPAMGKTALLLNLALATGEPFGIISSEQAHDQIGVRMLAIKGNINGNRIRRGTMEEDDWAKLTSGYSLLKDKQFWVNDDSNINIDQITSQARTWKRKYGIKSLWCDYIQRFKPTNNRMNTIEKVTNTTEGLKSIAKELRIPVIALGQVKREVENRPNKRPLAGDASDASAIDKEADSIWTLYRDEIYNEDSEFKGIAEINVCKSRHGPTGVIRCVYTGPSFKFSDFAPQHYQDRGY